jgi:peptidoglycan/xylan/chitin deacetylase (PgdA/CDA1 family)
VTNGDGTDSCVSSLSDGIHPYGFDVGLTKRLHAATLDQKIRSRLRAHPQLQGNILAPLGTFRRLPHCRDGIFFPFYHAVPEDHADGLRRHLRRLQRRGAFIDWDQALAMLAAPTSVAGLYFCLSFDDGDKSWVRVLLPLLEGLGIPAKFFVTCAAVDNGRSASRLTWDDCRELLRRGMHIGSHSLTHRRLANLDEDTAWAELIGSKEQLAAGLGEEILDYCPPYGMPETDYLVERDPRLAVTAGYRSFATTVRGRMKAGDSPMFILREGLSPAWPIAAVKVRLHE